MGIDIGLELAHGLAELHAKRHAQNLAGEGGDAVFGIARLMAPVQVSSLPSLSASAAGTLAKAAVAINPMHSIRAALIVFCCIALVFLVKKPCGLWPMSDLLF